MGEPARLRPWLIVFLLLVIHGVSHGAARKDDNDDENNSWSKWKPLFLRRRHREQYRAKPSRFVWNETASAFREAILDRAIQLNGDLGKFLPSHGAIVLEETQQLSQSIQTDFLQFGNHINRKVRTLQQEFKKGLLRDIFHQYVGWKRLRHSIRDHLGLVVGFWVTFRGQVDPLLASRVHGGKGGAWTLHFGQMVWRILNTGSQLGHFPWLHDIVASTVAVIFWKYFLPGAHPLLSQGLVLFAITLLPLCSLVLEELALSAGKERDAPFPVVATIVGVIILSLKLAQIPIPMVASSLSGAMLVYDSVRAEIKGNWIHMIEVAMGVIFPLGRSLLRMVHRLLLLIRRPLLHLWRQWLKGLVNKVLYPEATKNLIGQLVSLFQKMWQAITYPINNAKEKIANVPVIKKVNLFAQRLRGAIRPVLVPFGIATWGVAAQMGYISGLGGAWKVFQMTINPVGSVKRRINDLLSPESRIRKVLIGAIRSLPRQLQRFRQSRENTAMTPNQNIQNKI